MKKIKEFFLLAFFFAMSNVAFCQTMDEKLVIQMYEEGAYEAAFPELKKMAYKYLGKEKFHEYFIGASVKLGIYNDAQILVKKLIKSFSQKLDYQIDYLWLKKKKEKKFNEAKSIENLLNNLEKNDLVFHNAYKAFAQRKWTFGAEKTLKNALRYFPNSSLIIESNIQWLKITEKSYDLYEFLLTKLLNKQMNIVQINGELSEHIESPNFLEEVVQVLIKYMQKNPDKLILNELLVWVFVQKERYHEAFKQTIALEKREQREGERTFFFAIQMMRLKKWDHAEQALQYVSNLGRATFRYREAKMSLIQIKKSRLEQTGFQQLLVTELNQEFERYFEEFGVNENAIDLQLDYAEFQLLFLNQSQKAAKELQNILAYSGLSKKQIGKTKLLLADAYLVDDEIWEAQLLYGQVDKAFKEDILGQEARLKNARLSYYKGDFAWSKEQLNILKRATSRLIANDAMELSILISDNTGLDSTETALQRYAQAELLLYQNRFQESLSILDALPFATKNETLNDEIIYLKARIMAKQRNWLEAIFFYNLVAKDFPEDILADNALWHIANLYENQLKNKTEAIDTYQKLVYNYTNSVFSVAARSKIKTIKNEIERNLE